jgi:hypothetical protein
VHAISPESKLLERLQVFGNVFRRKHLSPLPTLVAIALNLDLPSAALDL